MKAVNVSQLQSNPSAALQAAREHPVMVLRRDRPEALLVHLDNDAMLAEPSVRQALAVALYRDQCLSLGRAAHFSGVPLAQFIRHVSRLGIPVVRGDAGTVQEDAEALVAWKGGLDVARPLGQA